MKACCKYWSDGRLMINDMKSPQGPVKYCPVCGELLSYSSSQTFGPAIDKEKRDIKSTVKSIEKFIVFTTECWRYDVTAKTFDEAYDKVHNQNGWDKKILEDSFTTGIHRR